MQIIRSIDKMQTVIRGLIADGKKIGLVPTMGFLHEGHLSLINRAIKESDVVITSIFVNPTQFGPQEDLDKYPRDEKGDIEKIKKAGGKIVFIPKAADMYPEDFQTNVSVDILSQKLEGLSRPNHFRGVTTIVAKLFNICRPDLAVFGMKDFQQAVVLKKMSDDLNYPIKITIAPTIREKDGLAMSSRNSYFEPDQRKEATCLYKALKYTQKLVKDDNIRETIYLSREIKKTINKFCPSAVIDYIAFNDMKSLDSVDIIERNCVCSLAVKVHGVRLIDNKKIS